MEPEVSMVRPDSLYKKRKFTNALFLTLCSVALVIGLIFLSLVLWTLIEKGLPSLESRTFTQMTAPPGSEGGLLNAIVGSFVMVIAGTLIGTPIGVMAGTYLAEYGQDNWLSVTVRFVNSIFLSAPSVIIGFFVYTILVSKMNHFSGIAGTVALAMIVIPIVTSTTENMLRLVPNSLREAAVALGAPRWRVTMFVVYRSAKVGILTGILLAVARISGETAPLLFTALNNQFWSLDLTKPMANLPVVIFQFAMSPYEDWQKLAWSGAFLITFGVLLLNIIAKIFLRQKR